MIVEISEQKSGLHCENAPAWNNPRSVLVFQLPYLISKTTPPAIAPSTAPAATSDK